jgi:Chalcone isomerase-like
MPYSFCIALPRFQAVFASLVMAAAAVTSLPPAHAATIDVAGIQVADTATVGGATLPLNGAGIRFRGPFKAYTAALYVGKKSGTFEEVQAVVGPKRIVLTMLREVDAEDLGRLFMRNMEKNTPRSDMLKIMTALPRMGDIFSSQNKMAAGESIVMDWIPGTGTVISVKGKIMGQPFKEPEFFNALAGIWLGKDPADWMLKNALLGTAK